MKNIKTNRPEMVCLPFAGVTPFHKKFEKNYLKPEVKTSSYPSTGGFRFF